MRRPDRVCPACRHFDRQQIDGRRLDRNRRREPECRRELGKTLGKRRGVEALQRVECFHFDVQSLDQRRRERSDLRHVAAQQHLGHVFLPVLLQIQERPAKFGRQTIREHLAILRGGRTGRLAARSPNRDPSHREERRRRRSRAPTATRQARRAHGPRPATTAGAVAPATIRRRTGSLPLRPGILRRRWAAGARESRRIRRRRTTLRVSDDALARRASPNRRGDRHVEIAHPEHRCAVASRSRLELGVGRRRQQQVLVTAAHVPHVHPRAARERSARGKRFQLVGEGVGVVEVRDRGEVMNAKCGGLTFAAPSGRLSVDDVASESKRGLFQSAAHV